MTATDTVQHARDARSAEVRRHDAARELLRSISAAIVAVAAMLAVPAASASGQAVGDAASAAIVSGAPGVAGTEHVEATSTALPPELAARFDSAAAILEAHRRGRGILGLSAAVAVDGRLVWTDGFGFANLQNRAAAWSAPPSPPPRDGASWSTSMRTSSVRSGCRRCSRNGATASSPTTHRSTSASTVAS